MQKKNVDKKVIDFISRYHSLYAQLDVKIPNPHLQKMFIKNFQSHIQEIFDHDEIFLLYALVHNPLRLSQFG